MTPRIATLDTVKNTDADKCEVPGEFLIPNRIRQLLPPSPGESIVYWECQGRDRMCGLHCINTILQGPVYTEVDLSSIALRLDDEERKLIYATSGVHDDAFELLAGGSSNAADDGFFSITVLEECLKRNNISITPVGAIRAVISDPVQEEAFVCNHHQHWFSIRKLHEKWYNLDSLKAAPTRVGEFHMSALLYNLIEQGYSVFVVRSTLGLPLPLPNPSSIRNCNLNRNQFYLSDKQIDALIHLDQEYHRNALQAETSKYGGSPQEDSRPSSGVAVVATSNEHVWPVGAGRHISDPPVTLSASPSLSEDNDPELIEAIKLSMSEFVKSLPLPPQEPELDSMGAVTLQVRLPNQQRIQRRFNDDDLIKSMFRWIELEANSTLSSCASYQLIAAYPRRVLLRLGRESVEFISSDGQRFPNFGNNPLKDVLTSKQEAFTLQVI